MKGAKEDVRGLNRESIEETLVLGLSEACSWLAKVWQH